jgi:putative mycofactocin binding protein MftB
MLDRALALHPQVALRPEPFGALAYHYGNRRLIFLKHPDVVGVVRALADHPTLQATLEASGIAESRWPAFDRALTSLVESEMLVERDALEALDPSSPTVAGATP